MTTPRSEPDGPPRAPRTALEALRLLLPAHAFSGTELEELTALCELRAYPAEQVLIREGEPPDNLVYFLLDGQVSVTIQGRHILSLHNQGDTIGEMGLISAAPRSATVRTDVPSSFLIVDATLATDPMAGGNYKLRYYLGRIFNSILTEKLRTTSDRARLYEDMVRPQPRRRAAAALAGGGDRQVPAADQPLLAPGQQRQRRDLHHRHGGPGAAGQPRPHAHLRH